MSTRPAPLKSTIPVAPAPLLRSAFAPLSVPLINSRTSGSASVVSVKASPHLLYVASKLDVLYVVSTFMHIPLVSSIPAASFPA